MRLPGMSPLLSTAAAALVAALLVPVPSAQAAPPPTCQGETATIVGTPADDHITATPDADVIVALAGDDTVLGLGGDDLICGGDGADVLRGGAGDDRLHGQREAWSSDRGGTYLTPDVLEGGAGDDLLDVGDDPRRADWGSHGVLDFHRAGSAVTVDLAAGTATGAGTDTLVGAPAVGCGTGCAGVVVLGSAYDDVLLGSEDDDSLVGNAGDDRLEGRGGTDELRAEDGAGQGPADDDTLSGGDGNDYLVANRGRDSLSGDDGDDDVYSVRGGPSAVYGGAGDDHLLVQLSRRPGLVLDGGPGDDTGQLEGPFNRPGGGGRPTAALVIRADDLVVVNEVGWGTLADVEDLTLGSNVHWGYRGTDEPDLVRSLGLWLRARTFGGDDEVWGTRGPDRIDAGDGTDEVHGSHGRDRCVNAEVARSCELPA